MLARSLFITSISLISLTWMADVAAQCATQTIGAAEWINPQAVGRCPEGGQDRTLGHATATFQDQRVITGERGAGDFSFYNFSRLLVGPECEVKLDRVYYDSERDREVKQFSMYDADRCLMKADNSLAERPEVIVLQAPLAEIRIAGAAAYVFYAPSGEGSTGGGRAGLVPDGGDLPPYQIIMAQSPTPVPGTTGPADPTLRGAGARGAPASAEAAEAIAREYEFLVVKISEVGEVVVATAAEQRQLRRSEFMVWRSRGSTRLEGPARVRTETLALLNARLEGVVAAGERPTWEGEYILGDLPQQGRHPPLLQRANCLETNDCVAREFDIELEVPDQPDRPQEPVPDPDFDFQGPEITTTTPEVFTDFDFGGCIETATRLC